MNKVLVFEFLLLISFMTIVKSYSLESRKQNDLEDGGRYINSFAQNVLLQKMQCVTDTLDQIDDEYNLDGLWTTVQQRLYKNINNVFLCLKYQGNFQIQR